MHTVQEIEASLSNLSTDELQHIEHAIHDLYRSRRECVIYDDDYSIWTDQDQILVAGESFKLLDKEENFKEKSVI